jgi:CheY-like chemotaxis protein
MRILLVEDSAVDRFKIGACLKDWGLEFMAVERGTAALKLWKTQIHRLWFFSIGSFPASMASSFADE